RFIVHDDLLFIFQAEDGIRDRNVTGVQTCALPILPPAIPFARVIRSGSIPSASEANQLPVRTKPVWTSSAMNSTSLALHHSTTLASKPSAGTMKPPSPWIGSMMTGAKLLAPIWDSSDSMVRAAASSPLSPSRYG